jgi:AraC-like DNA-binding protein
VKPRSPGTASIILLRPIVVRLAQVSVPVDPFLASIGVTRDQLGDQDATVDGRLIQRAWSAAAAAAGDPDFGLHVGESIHPGSYDLIDYLGLSSSCFRETIERVMRYYRVLSENVEFSVVGEGEVTRWEHRPRVGPANDWRHAWECFLAASVAHARRCLGPDWRPRAVELTHDAPADTREHARIFAAPVRFGCACNCLVFSSADAERPLPSADPVLGRILTAYADELVGQIADPDSFVGRVRSSLLEQLRGGDPSLAHIARKLSVSRRTLQRKLGEAGTSHQQLLDQCRHELALQYLRRAHLAIGEIAFLLGFSQAHAFHRAFRRWTGKTPAAWRADH